MMYSSFTLLKITNELCSNSFFVLIWLIFVLEHYRHPKLCHIKFHDPTPSGSGWATPKMDGF